MKHTNSTQWDKSEAELIAANGGITGSTASNYKRGADAFNSARSYQIKQTQEWRDGWNNAAESAYHNDQAFIHFSELREQA